MKRTDVAVVGAGAAGLAAARELRRQGLGVVVLEARHRIGGRILSLHDPRLPLPIELGAEFVHGAAPVTHRLLAEAGIATIDLTGEHWRAHRGHLAGAAAWSPIDRVLRRIDPRAADRSFASFVDSLGARTRAADRRAALAFVEGYHAAAAADISALSLLPQDNSGSAMARVHGGYGQLPLRLAQDLAPHLHLGAAVKAVAWRRGHVQLTLRHHAAEAPDGAGRADRVTARAALITVPVGVLAADPAAPAGLRLEPDPPRIRHALGLVAMGSAVRLTCWFHEFPWIARPDVLDAAERTARAGFWSFGGPTFGVWWTAYPVQWPLAVAWCGGPKAAAIARQGAGAVETAAVAELAAALDLPRGAVTSRLLATWHHDWQHDPHAYGAYSYARVGGALAARSLSRPVGGTLFFAGEATDTTGHTGTVEGALASGLRAARQIGRALAAG